MSRFVKAIVPILAYSLSSMSMIFTNKLVLATFQFGYPSVLLIAQSSIAVFLLQLLNAFRAVEVEPFVLKTAVRWLPVTIMFSLMLYTGSKTLQFLSIPVITVFKNLTNLLIAYGDWYFFGQKVSRAILGSFLMMVIGSILSGYTDLQFHMEGYFWMAGNCVSQACYVLYMRQAKKDTKLSSWGMSYYNNLLGILIIGLGSIFSGELIASMDYPNLSSVGFIVAVVFSGTIGTGLSLSVFWVVSATSPTTYSMIGSLNKIPITLFSVLFFKTILSFKSGFSLGVGLLSGIVYTYAKFREQKKTKSLESELPLTKSPGIEKSGSVKKTW
eukprot:m.61866 g.61866  ORF g.61866 m.61866 type:complete len:328 (-) comp19310_c0_seq2:125-1108(-)